MTTDDPRYPLGPFQAPDRALSETERAALLGQLEEAPGQLRRAVAELGAEQLATPYRPRGWTLRQVAHHVPDSHLNAYVRFRLALTEDQPTVKPYAEDRWAELWDAKSAEVSLSLDLLEAVHRRWVLLLRTLTPAEWRRSLRHPEQGLVDLERTLALYAWHGRHHVAQITALRQRRGWA